MSAIRNFALVAVAAAALAGSARAQATTPGNPPVAGHHGHGNGLGGGMGAFKDLNLTDAQKVQIKAVREKYHAQNQASRDQAKPYRDAARAARQTGDTAAFRTNMEKASQLTSAVRQQEMNELLAVLTPEQRTKADAAMAKRIEERANRHAKRDKRRKD